MCPHDADHLFQPASERADTDQPEPALCQGSFGYRPADGSYQETHHVRRSFHFCVFRAEGNLCRSCRKCFHRFVFQFLLYQENLKIWPGPSIARCNPVLSGISGHPG